MATTGLLSGGGPLFGGTASDIGILGYTPTTPATTVARGSVDIPLEMRCMKARTSMRIM